MTVKLYRTGTHTLRVKSDRAEDFLLIFEQSYIELHRVVEAVEERLGRRLSEDECRAVEGIVKAVTVRKVEIEG